jgi:prophage antirepressor-like protein
MKSLVKKFMYENNELSIVEEEENIWFKCADVANILGYPDSNIAVRSLKFDDDNLDLNTILSKITGSETAGLLTFNKNNLNTIYISKFGLYNLIFINRNELTEKFEQWITTDLLPTIYGLKLYRLKQKLIKENVEQDKLLLETREALDAKSS